MSAPYRRVANDESSYTTTTTIPSPASIPTSSSSSSTTTTTVTRSRAERISDKIHALLWVAASLTTAHYTDTPRVLLSDHRILRPLFNLAVICFGINTILMLYLAIYLPKCKNITSSSAWEVYCPRVIPTMTVLGIITGLLLVRSTWPVWGFLSPLILGVESLGALFVLHFVPWL